MSATKKAQKMKTQAFKNQLHEKRFLQNYGKYGKPPCLLATKFTRTLIIYYSELHPREQLFSLTLELPFVSHQYRQSYS